MSKMPRRESIVDSMKASEEELGVGGGWEVSGEKEEEKTKEGDDQGMTTHEGRGRLEGSYWWLLGGGAGVRGKKLKLFGRICMGGKGSSWATTHLASV